MILEIDGSTLALTGAETAVLALVSINIDTEEAATRNESEQGTYRTDVITISTTTHPSHDGNDEEGAAGKDGQWQ